MTTPPTATPAPTLDEATFTTLRRSVFGALPIIPDATQKDLDAQHAAAVAFIARLDPCDPIEATLVARYACAHYAAIDAYHHVMRAKLPPTLHLRYQGKAVTLSRLASSLHRDLLRQQALRLFRPAAQPAEAPTEAAQPVPAAAPSAQPAAAAPNPPAPQPTPAPNPAAVPAAQRPAAAPRPMSAAKADRINAEFERLLADIAARAETFPAALAAMSGRQPPHAQ